jgi:enamine deaminase RidA (YjgF/YER057c/UK114 family)
VIRVSPGGFSRELLLKRFPSGAVLEAGGSSLAKAVKVNVFLANMDDFAAVNEVYAKFFPDPKPVSTSSASRLSICGC